MKLVCILALIALAGAARADGSDAAAALMQRFECHRCHEGTGLPPPPIEKQCVGCHRALLAGESPLGDPISPDVLARWQGNLRSLNVAPSLAASDRFRRDWLVAFLREPHDLRPGLPAMMPRLALSADAIALLAAHLSPSPGAALPPTTAEALTRGRSLYAAAGCDACHAFAGVMPRRSGAYAAAIGQPHSVWPSADAIALAPDLAVTRRRFRPERLVEWLRDPPAMKPDTPMPRIGLTAAQAQALAAFVMHAPLAPDPPPAVGERLPPLERPVSYAEVEARVLRKVCWHCHADAVLAHGDGGPGNSGGFGFPARGLDLSSYIGAAKGSRGDDGRRRSVFRPAPAAPAMPRLVAHLVARHHEVAGKPIPGLRGMPLGLPPLPWADIQLVESWIAQGRPR